MADTDKDYAALSRIFADAAERGGIWKESKKVWDMIESSTVNEWKAIGQISGARYAVREVLEARFGQVSPEIVRVINSIQDLPGSKAFLSMPLEAIRSRLSPYY